MKNENITIFFIMKKVFYLFFKNFWNGAGQLSAIIGIVSAFAFWVWKPNLYINIPLPVLFLFTLALVMFLWALGKTIYDLYTYCYDFSNPIIEIRNIPDFLGYGKGLIICKKYPWIYNNMIVSIYHNENSIDKIVGIGEVLEVQDNGIVQILILDMDDKYLKHLKDGIGVKEIKIKPFADKRFFRGILWKE